MNLLEQYRNTVEKTKFLLLSETGTDPRIIYRCDLNSGCLLVERILDEVHAPSFLYGSVPFTLSDSGSSIPAVLGRHLELYPGSVIWCVPVGVAFLSSNENLLLLEPDSLSYPVFQGKDAVSQVCWERVAHFYAENIAQIKAPFISFGTREQAEALVEKGLQTYKLKWHIWSRHS